MYSDGLLVPPDGGVEDIATSGSSSADLGGDSGLLGSSGGASSAGNGGAAMGVGGDEASLGGGGDTSLPSGGGVSHGGASNGSSGMAGSGGKIGAGGAAGHAGASSAGAGGVGAMGGSAGTSGADGTAGHAGSVGLGGSAGQSGAGQSGAGQSGAAQGGAGAGQGGAAVGGAGAGGGASAPRCSDHAITATSTWVPSVSSHSSDSAASNLSDGTVTRWTSGKPQAGDEWLQIDFGAIVNLRRINLQQGPENANDYPRSYAVYCSNTALDSSGPVRASGTGTSGVTTTIQLSSIASGRYLYLKQLGTSLSWWSVEELEVTCSDN
ncbi:MAG TPA: discoidin domain-containing protein [Polyangiaceae bacterium]